MRMRSIAFVLGLGVVLPLSASAQQIAPVPQIIASTRLVPHASSTGRGEVRVTPDHAIITAVVDTRADTAAKAAVENARHYDALVQALRSAGVPAAQISSPGFTVSASPLQMAFAAPVNELLIPMGATPAPSVRPPARSIPAVARRTVRIDSVRMGDVDRVVNAALAAGATQISVQLAAPSLASAQRAAMMAAVADARANADAMARGAGGTLGRLVDLTTSYSPFSGVMSYATPYETPAYVGNNAPVMVRDLTVTAMVTARWEIDMPESAAARP